MSVEYNRILVLKFLFCWWLKPEFLSTSVGYNHGDYISVRVLRFDALAGYYCALQTVKLIWCLSSTDPEVLTMMNGCKRWTSLKPSCKTLERIKHASDWFSSQQLQP